MRRCGFCASPAAAEALGKACVVAMGENYKRGTEGCHPAGSQIFIFDVATFDASPFDASRNEGQNEVAFRFCYNSLAMTIAISETILVPAGTVATAKGDGPSVDVSGAGHRVFLVTLAITKIIEQESIDLSIYGSADGAAWSAKSIAAFRQEFYCGEWPLLLDLTAHGDVKFVRAHWEVARWGRGTETPMFEFGVTMREVPANLLHEARAEARART
jgi:hypothetical protein